MRRCIHFRLHTRILLLCSALMLLLAQITWAAPGFDLDLKELKKPSQPAAPKKAATPPQEKEE